jgi:pantetheine-phosphate adenylyltransferase
VAKTIGVYPGSFDPYHRGHQYVVERAAILFDTLYVVVGANGSKTRMIPQDVAKTLIEKSIPDYIKSKVVVQPWNGLTSSLCREVKATHIVRGVRSGAEYDQEVALAQINRDMVEVDTVFIPSGRGATHVSSSLVRELVKYDKSKLWFYVSKPIAEYLTNQ